MKLLLDTHILLWTAGSLESATDALSETGKRLILDPDNELVFSSASIWEVAIKTSLGRPDFRADPHVLRRGLLDNGYEELSVTGAHAAAIVRLPPIHKDPFDRLLVAQAFAEGLLLVTADEVVARYPGPIQKV